MPSPVPPLNRLVDESVALGFAFGARDPEIVASRQTCRQTTLWAAESLRRRYSGKWPVLFADFNGASGEANMKRLERAAQLFVGIPYVMMFRRRFPKVHVANTTSIYGYTVTRVRVPFLGGMGHPVLMHFSLGLLRDSVSAGYYSAPYFLPVATDEELAQALSGDVDMAKAIFAELRPNLSSCCGVLRNGLIRRFDYVVDKGLKVVRRAWSPQSAYFNHATHQPWWGNDPFVDMNAFYEWTHENA